MNDKPNYMPTEKAPEIDQLLTSITGKDRKETIMQGKCATCNDPNMNFRDALSKKEYSISGMCQKCQDSVFGRA